MSTSSSGKVPPASTGSGVTAASAFRFVEESSERIELFFLPPYSPELNPDELAWAHVKTKVAPHHGSGKAELKMAVKCAMRQLQKMHRIVARFFHEPSCVYASL